MKFVNLISVLATSTSHKAEDIVIEAYDTFINIVNIIMPVLISVVVAFGLVYGIILGIKFAKAEETEARDKAKQQLINLVIGCVVAAVIMSICYVLLGSSWIRSLFPENKIKNDLTSSAAGFLPAMFR